MRWRCSLALALLAAGCGGEQRRDGPILFDGTRGLRAIDPDGTNLRRVARQPAARSDAVSPDGASVAYAAARAIWLLDLASGRRTRLTEPPPFVRDSAPRWSPDGERISFERGGDVWAVDADGGAAELLLAAARDARWSPDGRRLAFVRDAPNLVGDVLGVADSEGHDQRPVSELGAFTEYGWSPDGRALAYVSFQVSRFRLYVAEAPDFVRRELIRDASGAPAWAPSGRRLAVAAGTPPQIWVLDPRGGRSIRVGRGRDPRWLDAGALSMRR